METFESRVDFVKLAERIVNEQNLRRVVADKYAQNNLALAKEIKTDDTKKVQPVRVNNNLDLFINSALVVTGMALVGLFVYGFL